MYKSLLNFKFNSFDMSGNDVGCCKQPSTPGGDSECEVVEGHGGGLHQLAHQHREHLGPQRAGDDEHCADLRTNNEDHFHYTDIKA